ncbi:MAG: DNA polymerase III subunit beta [Clostridia bacterium]|nr:DNA polymerase III subunit beta [Clostridia bacterium]
MIFTTQRSELLEAVQNLSRIVTKTSQPVLEGILISAEKGKITLVSYNLEMSMKKEIYASTEADGDIVISARLLTEILRKSDGIQVTIESDERLMCHIRSGNAVFDIMGMSAEDFPETPSVPETEKITMPGGLLKDMVRGTLFAVATTEGSRPILTGLNITVQDGIAQFIGIDGRRMGIRKENIGGSLNCNFVISGKAIGEAVKIINNDEENVDIFITKMLVSFKIDGYTLVSRLLEGVFVNYEKAIPKEFFQKLTVRTKDIIDIIERISLVVNDRLTTPVRCSIGNPVSTFKCISALGCATDTYETKLEGPEFEIGINAQYLLDALRATESDEVKMSFKGGSEGFLIEPIEGDSFLYMVMPMRIK